MATASVTNTFLDATTIQAADHNTNFSDLVTFLNASVVHVDGSKAMTATLDLGNFGFKNVGNFFKPYVHVVSTPYIVTAAQTWEDIGPTVTVTDPGVPVHVAAFAHAAIYNSDANAALNSWMRLQIDGDISPIVTAHTPPTQNTRGFLGVQDIRTFDPTGNFVVKVQGRQETTGVIDLGFDEMHLMAIVWPQ